ncbi:MAG: cytochrome c3 family protein [Acidobacteria bacterium]|nr:cytochrome c3 family protein [Acidobacteriota bacterium]
MKKFVYLAVAVMALALIVGPAVANAQTPPTTVILKGNPMGGVKFDHAAHQKVVGDKCDTCHHASKPEKAMKGKQEKCQNCHTKEATAPMKTTTKLAFHDAMAKKGTCIDCHAKATGKKVPTSKCMDCHKKENA